MRIIPPRVFDLFLDLGHRPFPIHQLPAIQLTVDSVSINYGCWIIILSFDLGVCKVFDNILIAVAVYPQTTNPRPRRRIIKFYQLCLLVFDMITMSDPSKRSIAPDVFSNPDLSLFCSHRPEMTANFMRTPPTDVDQYLC